MRILLVITIMVFFNSLSLAGDTPTVAEILKEYEHRIYDGYRSSRDIYPLASSNQTEASNEFPKEMIIYGLSAEDVLRLDGVDEDDDDHPCSSRHDYGDESNRWCHAAIVEVIDKTLQEAGMNKFLSMILSFSVFVVKEYAYDLNPSKSDIVTPSINLFKADQNKEYGTERFVDSLDVTVFLDGRVHFSLSF